MQVRDHREQLFPIVNPASLVGDPRSRDPVFRAMLAKATGGLQAAPVWRIWLGALVIPMFVLLGLGAGHLVDSAFGSAGYALIGGALLGGIGGYFLIEALSKQAKLRANQRVIGHMLADGVCPSCAYSINGLIAENDGCRVCPECGAAWSNDCILREHEFRQEAETSDRRPRFGRSATAHRKRLQADHRGELVPIVGRDLRWAIATAPNDDVRERLTACRDDAARSSRPVRLLLAGLSLAYWGLMVFATISSARGSGIFGAAVFSVIAFTWAWSFWRGNWGITRPGMCRVMLSGRLCPSCTGDLTGLTAENDGCVVCSECLAAWRQPGTSTAHKLEESVPGGWRPTREGKKGI